MRRIFEPLRPESNHLLHLDALRLIASVGIVVHHIVPFIDDGAGAEQLLMMSAPLAHFVDMFFVVSGFVIAFIYSNKIADSGSYASFMRKRVARLAPLHWATLAFFVVIGIALQARNIDRESR
jgi:peptidoglycan/LPS O-acetylase OafA/YrhL